AECTNLANRLAAVRYPTTLGEGMDRFGYDARSRRVFSGRRFGTLADLWTRIEYDNIDRPIGYTYSDGKTVELELDALDRVLSISGFVDAVSYSEQRTFDSITYANGARVEFEHDALLRTVLKRHIDGSGAVIDALRMTHDPAGNLLTVTDERGPLDVHSHTASFALDSWYRVVGVDRDAGSVEAEELEYAYDMLDRVSSILSSKTEASAAHLESVTYSVERPLAVTSAGSLSFEHDGAGLLSKRGDMDFARDHLGRLRVAATQDAQEIHDYGLERSRVLILGQDRMVLYGFAGHEVRDGVSRVYTMMNGQRLGMRQDTDGMAALYGDPDGDGVLTSADAYAMSADDGERTRQRVLGAVAARMLADERDATTFLHTDHVRSIIAATDEGGEVLGRQGFYGFGQRRFLKGHVDDAYGFTGQEHNAFTGLIEFKMRDLDPVLGRWASFDPLFAKPAVDQMAVLGESTTGYAYVGNGFADRFDPLGLVGGKGEGKPALPQTTGGGGGGVAARPTNAGATNAGGGAAAGGGDVAVVVHGNRGNNNGGAGAGGGVHNERAGRSAEGTPEAAKGFAIVDGTMAKFGESAAAPAAPKSELQKLGESVEGGVEALVSRSIAPLQPVNKPPTQEASRGSNDVSEGFRSGPFTSRQKLKMKVGVAVVALIVLAIVDGLTGVIQNAAVDSFNAVGGLFGG
ncbi:MAG: RHS repeat-associated core domain-containing protein, partial [Myxococcota bacterium]